MPERYAGRGRSALAPQLVSFAAVGVFCTVVYIVCFVVFSRVLPTQPANALGLLASAFVNTAANRRVTFGISGREGAALHHAQGLVAFAAGLAVTAGALALLDAADPSASRAAQVVVLVAATAVATVLRFAILRYWVFAAARWDRAGGVP